MFTKGLQLAPEFEDAPLGEALWEDSRPIADYQNHDVGRLVFFKGSMQLHSILT